MVSGLLVSSGVLAASSQAPIAAQDIAHVGEPVLAQQACGDRRPVAAGAVARRSAWRDRARSTGWAAAPTGMAIALRDGARFDLARIAHVDDLQIAELVGALVEGLGRQPGRTCTSSRWDEHHLERVGRRSRSPGRIRSGRAGFLPSSSCPGSVNSTMSTSEAQHRSGELGVAALQADVDGVAQMTRGELLRAASVDQHGARRRALRAPARRSSPPASRSRRAARGPCG